MKNSGRNIIVSHSWQSSLCIRWTVMGKVSDVIRTAGSQKPDLHFDYDAMGQRIVKTVTNKNVTMGDKFVTTYYVRDPQGNVLAVYEHKHGESGNGTFTLAEQHLYGAGRLGMRKRDLALNTGNANESPATYYELTNHLGNVMAVISDEASSTNEPTVVSLSDYYPFGMTEPGRSWNAGDYRFGYTGHEKENDLAEGVYTTEYRLLDTRLGRWMSVDPLFAKYADMSAYNYCGGNPVAFWDPDGSELHNFYPNDYQNIKIDKNKIDLSKCAEDCRYDVISLTNVIYCETDKNAFQQVALLNCYEDDDALHIAGHGVCEGQFFRTDDGLIATSEVIRNLNTKDYDIIVLHSCETGKESDQYQYKFDFVNGTVVKASISFANQISKEMPEKYIVAPSEV